MGNECSCYHKEDEIEIKTRENLLKLRKVSVDSTLQKEFEVKNEAAKFEKTNSPSKIKYEESERQKDPENLDKMKTIDSSIVILR